jgi:alkanesulfonate monooxygenase SsuD/methylene tetrahydromethanopterin reductase-like flavin-dependent oxidoreductase (luciferase family)
MLQYSVVGGPERVAKGLRDFIDLTQADEIMVAGLIHDHAARLRSFEIVADVMKTMKPQKAAADA